MKKIRKIMLNESIQLGPTATSSIDVDDPNHHRRTQFAGIEMELDEATALVTIKFRGQEIYVHASACRYIVGLTSVAAGVQVTHYDPNAEGDELEVAPVAPQAEDPDEFDDPPPALTPKKKGGRPRKVVVQD